MEDYLTSLKSILHLKVKLHKLKILLSLDQSPAQIKTLSQFIKDLTHEIRFQEDALETARAEDQEPLSLDILEPSMQGMLCQVFHQEHNRWYFARINSVNFETQKAKLKFIAYDEEEKEEDSFHIRLLPETPEKCFIQGSKVSYLETESGKLKLGIILETIENKVHLKDEVSGKVITLGKELVLDPEVFYVKERNKDGSVKIPDRLIINPNDTKAERVYKKKKIKKIKFEEKTKEINNFYNDKKQSWQQFQKSVVGSGKGIVGGLKK